MNMKWMVVFCCSVILILGGLLAGTTHLYRQDSEEYQRLLVEAEVTRERDIQVLVAQNERELIDLQTEVGLAMQKRQQDDMTIKALRELYATEKEKFTDMRQNYFNERSQNLIYLFQLEVGKEKAAVLREALNTAIDKTAGRARWFKDVRELKDYLEGYEPGLRGFDIDLNGALCVPAAINLMFDALEHGFIIDTEIDEDNKHAVGKTIIDRQYYFIEPQTKEIFRYLGSTKWEVGS